MVPVNVLILIHGITLEAEPRNHRQEYDQFVERLLQKHPRFKDTLTPVIHVEWGHAPPGVPPNDDNPDQYLTAAENFLNQCSNYDRVKTDPSPYNHPRFYVEELLSIILLRRLTQPIKEAVFIRGITDALYYCAPDGEQAIRKQVYSQFLQGMTPYQMADQVRLHIVAHSLGATVAFDFLFGLFAPDTQFPEGVPGFVAENQAESAAISAQYLSWRDRAQHGSLVLASLSTTGGQIPLLMLRKQKLVQSLAEGKQLDPTVIGVQRSGVTQWKNFFDVDDVLGFPTRRLFDAQGSL
jgi:hypothetical protein